VLYIPTLRTPVVYHIPCVISCYPRSHITALKRSFNLEPYGFGNIRKEGFNPKGGYINSPHRPSNDRDTSVMARNNVPSPNLIESNWNYFDPRACDGEGEESLLGASYQKPLPGYEHFFSDLPDRHRSQHLIKLETASFTEFWQTFESGSLI
jgi:hypothetical protein